MAIPSHVVECIVAIVVAALASSVRDEYKLLTGASGEAAFLTSELLSMRAFLDSASAADAGDAQLRASAEEIRKLSSDVERGVHAYNTAANGAAADLGGSSGHTGLRAFVKRCARLPSAAWSRRRAAEEVLGLKIRVVEAAERRRRYRVGDDLAGAGRRCRICLCAAAGRGGSSSGDTAIYSFQENNKIQGN